MYPKGSHEEYCFRLTQVVITRAHRFVYRLNADKMPVFEISVIALKNREWIVLILSVMHFGFCSFTSTHRQKIKVDSHEGAHT